MSPQVKSRSIERSEERLRRLKSGEPALVAGPSSGRGPRIRRNSSLLVEFLASKPGVASKSSLLALDNANMAALQRARGETLTDAAAEPGRARRGSRRQKTLTAKRSRLRAENKKRGPEPTPEIVRILLADDHPVVRRGVKAIVEGDPTFQIVGEASSGPETIEKVKALEPLIVILDISMPSLNGLDVTRQLRREAPGVRVLILTMHFAEEVARECLKAGARAYLLKTDAETDLLAAVRAVRDEKPFLTPQIKDMYYTGYMECIPKAPVDANGEVPLTRLSAREREVVKMLCQGMSNKEVASAVGISTRTVESHRTNIMHKLNLDAFSDMVRYAVRHHVIAP
jgi:DNA-binding NarL/FixJ family response regulator